MYTAYAIKIDAERIGEISISQPILLKSLFLNFPIKNTTNTKAINIPKLKDNIAGIKSQSFFAETITIKIDQPKTHGARPVKNPITSWSLKDLCGSKSCE